MIVCAKCQVELRCEKSGIAVVEMARACGTPEGPYQIWHADLYKCPVCGAEIVTGFANEPLAQHWEDHFYEVLEAEKQYNRVIYSYEKKEDVPA